MIRKSAQPVRDEGAKVRGQRGHLMAGLMAAVAILMIFSAMAFQAWSEVLRRDNEAEMIFRAQEIVRAIQRYRKDHGGIGPEKLKDLMEPGPRGQYYMRRLYTDPLVPDGKWGLLFMGPGGTIVDPSVTPEEGGLGQGLGSGLDRLGDRGAGGTQQQQQQQQGQRGGPEARRLDTGRQARAGGLGGVGNRQPDSGETGGLRIAGVKSLCEDSPFRVYKQLTEYSQWLFTYLDLEQQQIPGQGRPGAKQKQQQQQQFPGRGRGGLGRGKQQSGGQRR
jgi:type II secretory pathway pseudopilin PulG